MDKLIDKISKLSLSKYDDYLQQTDIKLLKSIKTHLDDIYYNTSETTLVDYRYDLLKDALIDRDKDFKVQIGATIRENEKRVKLPYYLGSADKISYGEEKELQKWLSTHLSNKYVISAKLDGISCLLYHKSGKTHLYTRGDGSTGSDITHIKQYINIPMLKEDIAIRGELIIPKETFNEKYKEIYKNPRNMVSGLVSRKTLKEALSDIHFVVYEIVEDNMYEQSKQLDKLRKVGFETVQNIQEIKEINMDTLSTHFLKFRESSEYELDGLIVQLDDTYDRNTSGNPDYMFAFKMNLSSDVHETKVKYIEWNVSKWGYLKPVIIIEPVETNGITISRVTANHAKYIVDNKLGPDSIIKVTRSKEVIPFIVGVSRSSSPQMPDTEYIWDKNNVNIIVKNHDNTMTIKQISDFFAKLNIKYVSEATVSKMFENGLDTILKIVSADKSRLLQISEFKEKSAERIYTNIRNGLKNVKITTVLGASGMLGYGIGEKKLEALFSVFPDILSSCKQISKPEIINLIKKVDGFSDITAEKITDKIEDVRIFIENLSKVATFKSQEKISNTLQGQKIVMTGFRDQLLEEHIVKRGGKIVNSVSKNTSILIIKDIDKVSSKLEKATQLGIKIYNKVDFEKEYIS